MDYKVKDIKLAKQGKLKIEWAEDHMPVLMKIREEFKKKKPFKGLNIGCCLHVTKETAVLVKILKAGGAKVGLCQSNPLSTQDDVAAALAEEGIHIYAWRGCNNKEYYWCLNKVLDLKPTITVDDGADLISTIHSGRQELIDDVYAGQEETTTGVIRLRAMEKDGALKYPIIAVNDTPTKHLFDNYYGTGQSTIDGILRSTNIMFAGKTFVMAGYGDCGGGIAERAKGMGANVIVTEVSPVRALKAAMDGYRVMTMEEAAKLGDIFVTSTGDRDIITKKHFKLMKNGAIVANSGHFNVEVDVKGLEELAKYKKEIRNNTVEYTLKNGKKIYLLSEGRLVNLAGAEGHPCNVMDMSFANHALSADYVVKNHKKLENKVYVVPEEIDKRIARLKLGTMGIEIDKLTKKQEKYLNSWQEGT
ncbi:MAG: adenosylhomocysteinase [Candidatus Aenigmarchaeota archaeon]|nr:adenosylhomocysteinase [Candidatus Aenigmarchaeota archaeon]